MRADNVEGAGLGGENWAAIQFAKHERTNAERIAGADELLIGEPGEGVRAFEHAQALDQPVDKTIAVRAGHQMQDHFRIGGGLHHGAVAHELTPQAQAVRKIAIMADRKSAGI